MIYWEGEEEMPYARPPTLKIRLAAVLIGIGLGTGPLHVQEGLLSLTPCCLMSLLHPTFPVAETLEGEVETLRDIVIEHGYLDLF